MGRFLMYTQYLAARHQAPRTVATLESQNLATVLSTYPAAPDLGMMPLGRTCVRPALIAGNMAGFDKPSRTTSYRSYRCRRTSNCWQPSASWSWLLPVRASSRSKNLSWLIQNRSAKSPSTQANTSKRQSAGRAFASVLTLPLITEGAAWH